MIKEGGATRVEHGELVIPLLVALALAKGRMLSEATLTGLANAKALGRVGGRPSAMSDADRAKAQEMRASGKYTMAEIAKAFQVSRSTLYSVGLAKTKGRPRRTA